MASIPTTTDHDDNPGLEVATLGGGCFWCLEAVYDRLQGVTGVVSGYSGGHVVNPTYRQVCNANTGHAEVVQVTFDPQEISFREILEVFFTVHDPTTLNRQGNDVGPQYRSAIFYHSPKQKAVAEAVIAELNAADAQRGPNRSSPRSRLSTPSTRPRIITRNTSNAIRISPIARW